jgi:hypothetical protein
MTKILLSAQTGQEKEKEMDRRSRMHSVEESLLRNRHSYGSETDAASGRERASTIESYGRQKGRERERESEGAAIPNAFSRSLLRSRHSVRKSKIQGEKEQAQERSRQKERERESEQRLQSNAFSRGEPTTKPSFIKKRNRSCIKKRRKRDIYRKKEKGSEQ